MKKVFSLLVLLSLTASVAMATVPAPDLNYEVGDTSASATQTITVTIPERVAIHIDKTEWNLDLNELGKQDYCFAVPKSFAAGLEGDLIDAFFGAIIADIPGHGWTEGSELYSGKDGGALNALAGRLEGMHLTHLGSGATYPPVDFDNDGAISGDSDKGYLLCYTGKVVQKFANHGPWELQVSFINSSNFGVFGMLDAMPNASGVYQAAGDGFTVTGSDSSEDYVKATLASGNHTGGWLDDWVFEGFYFDGSEKAGTHTLNIKYTLTTDL